MTQTLILDAIGFLGAMALLWFITERAGSVVTPAHLFSLVWGPCILAAQFFTKSSEPLSPETVGVLFGAWWALLAGVLWIIHRPAAVTSTQAMGKYPAITLMLLLFALQLIVVVYEASATNAGALPTREAVLALRGNQVLADRSNKVPWFLEIFRNAHFVYLPLAMLLRKRKWLSRRMFCILLAAACLLALYHMTRAPLMGVMVTVWASWVVVYMPRGRRAWAVAAGAIIAFSAVFLAVQGVLSSQRANVSEDDNAVSLVVEGYYGGSMRAFESIVDGTFPRQDGFYSADMVYYVLNKLKMVDEEDYPSIVRPYASNGTNIYTFLDAYMLDGGIFLALLGAALTGVAGGWLFNRVSSRPSPLLVTCYALFAYYMVMAVANNEFIRIQTVTMPALAAVVGLVVSRRTARGTLPTALRAQPPISIAAAQSLSGGRNR